MLTLSAANFASGSGMSLILMSAAVGHQVEVSTFTQMRFNPYNPLPVFSIENAVKRASILMTLSLIKHLSADRVAFGSFPYSNDRPLYSPHWIDFVSFQIKARRGPPSSMAAKSKTEKNVLREPSLV